MTTYDNLEAWKSLYEKYKPDRNAALVELKNQPHSYDEDARGMIWRLCVAVANEVKNNHNKIKSARSGGLSYRFYSVVNADVTNQTISIEYKEDVLITDRTTFDSVVNQSVDTIDEVKHVFKKGGGVKGEQNKVLPLRNVLPMLSLGIFQKGGKDWLEWCDNDEIIVGDKGEKAVSLSGHLENSDSKPLESTLKGYKSTADEVKEICSLLELRKNVILEGVPGTGKTRIRKDVQKKMIREVKMEIVTFHPASTYEEFVGGIFPFSKAGGKLLFKYQEGVLTRFANEAMEDLERDYILFIDEINRANIPLVMGELLTIIESTKRTKPAIGTKALSDGPRVVEGEPWEVAVHVEKEDESSKYLRLPSNLYFLATMNTSDRSVVSMDAALRRRFAYYRIETKLTTEGQEEMRKALKNTVWKKKLGSGELFEQIFSVLVEVNEYLREEIGPDAMLGHSYLFIKEDEMGDLNLDEVIAEMMELNILPQIADTLTSMDKTNAVNSINEILNKIPKSRLYHKLKEPTSGSLDIAVTVCNRISKENELINGMNYSSDDIIWTSSNDNDCENGKMKSIGAKYTILKGSGSREPSPTFMTLGGGPGHATTHRNRLIELGIIKIDNNRHGTFTRDYSTYDKEWEDVFDKSPSHMGSLTVGTTFSPRQWKNENWAYVKMNDDGSMNIKEK